MIISIKDNWKKAEKKHSTFLKKKIDSYLNNYTLLDVGPQRPSVYFLQKTSHLIMSFNEKDLLLAAKYYLFFCKHLSNSDNNEAVDYFRSELVKVFDYHNFINKKISYDAYELCDLSKTRTCPYCNHAYAFTKLSDDGRGFRPTLDHFYPKDKYPHLALSLYNLVPSCSTCNSSLKGDIDFARDSHLNPLFDEEVITFRLETSKSKSDISKLVDVNTQEFYIDLQHDGGVKSENSIKTFILEGRYQSFIYEAVGLVKHMIYLDDLRRNTQIELTQDIDEPYALMFDPGNYQDFMLGKLLNDVYNQFS